MYGHQPGKVANPARGQLNKENEYRKEQSKRPHQSKPPREALQIAKTRKKIEQTPRGGFFSRFFVRKAPGARPREDRDASQHAVGGIARVYFFLLCLDQWTQHDQTNIFFLSGSTPGVAFYPIFVLKNALGTLQTPRRRYFGIVLRNAPRGVYSVLCGFSLSRFAPGSTVPSRVSLLISILRLKLVLTYGILREFRSGVHLFMYRYRCSHTYMHIQQ